QGMAFRKTRNTAEHACKLRGNCARKRGARMALRLRDVQCDPIANRALNELMHHYAVAEEKIRLVLTKKAGDMKLFLYDLDDLHQLISSIISKWRRRSNDCACCRPRSTSAGRAGRSVP